MNKVLKDIATVQTGVFAKTMTKGEIVYLQSKHFDEYGKLNATLYPELKFDNQTGRHLLKQGDVLFAAKGSKNFTALYESDFPAVASTSFFVIRIHGNFKEKILSEFLVWQLNHPTFQLLLKGKAIGTSIASISKSVLEEVEIHIPAIQIQETILKIAKMRNEEVLLRQQIETLKEQQVQQQIFNVLHK